MAKIDHKEIWLVPMGCGDYDWCDSPAPGNDMEEADSIKYVRADTVQALTDEVARLGEALGEAAKDHEDMQKGFITENRPLAASWHAKKAAKIRQLLNSKGPVDGDTQEAASE